MRRIALLLASLCVIAGGAATTAGAESPLPNGCPSGYELISVDAVENPLQAVTAERVDTGGNNDGYACRRALGDGIFHTFPGRPDTVYHWADNFPGFG
jgi:hypothetical protein